VIPGLHSRNVRHGSGSWVDHRRRRPDAPRQMGSRGRLGRAHIGAHPGPYPASRVQLHGRPAETPPGPVPLRASGVGASVCSRGGPQVTDAPGIDSQELSSCRGLAVAQVRRALGRLDRLAVIRVAFPRRALPAHLFDGPQHVAPADLAEQAVAPPARTRRSGAALDVKPRMLVENRTIGNEPKASGNSPALLWPGIRILGFPGLLAQILCPLALFAARRNSILSALPVPPRAHEKLSMTARSRPTVFEAHPLFRGARRSPPVA
jgi:hypothetical protein